MAPDCFPNGDIILPFFLRVGGVLLNEWIRERHVKRQNINPYSYPSAPTSGQSLPVCFSFNSSSSFHNVVPFQDQS
jgi:hypothetical protein